MVNQAKEPSCQITAKYASANNKDDCTHPNSPLAANPTSHPPETTNRTFQPQREDSENKACQDHPDPPHESERYSPKQTLHHLESSLPPTAHRSPQEKAPSQIPKPHWDRQLVMSLLFHNSRKYQ